MIILITIINNAIIIVTGSLFLVTTILAVWKYGSNITANILQLIPGNFIMSIVVLIAALQLCLSSVLSHSTLFQDLEDQCNIKRSMIF